MTYAPSVTIAIVNYNTRDALRDCLLSIERVRGEAECRVIVVDNASTDGTSALMKHEFPQTQLIVNSENVGFASAVNQALSAADSSYFLLLNPDTWLAADSLTRLLEVAESDPGIAVVGAQLTSFEGELQPSVLSPPTLFKEFLNMLPEIKTVLLPRALKRRLHRRRQHQQDDKFFVPAVSGGAMLVRSEAFRSVNGMDPRFFVYHEEVDLCLRLRSEGWKIAFAPSSQVLHHDALSTGFRQNRFPSEPVLTWRLTGVSLLFEKHASDAAHRKYIRMAVLLLRLRSRVARLRGCADRANELDNAAVRLSQRISNRT